MPDDGAIRDRWGNLISPEPPSQTVPPPPAAGLGRSDTYKRADDHNPFPPPPHHRSCRSNYPPPPAPPIHLPPPSRASRPAGGAFDSPTSFPFASPGIGGPPAQLRQVSTPDLTGATINTYLHPISTAPSRSVPPDPLGPSDKGKRYAASLIKRPSCSMCEINRVNVTEDSVFFCDGCFQEALRRRGKKHSPRAHRPLCSVCRKNYINVEERGTLYCQVCWQDRLWKGACESGGTVGQ